MPDVESEEERYSDSEEESGSLASAATDSDSEGEHQGREQAAPAKKRRLDAGDSLGLELVAAPLGGGAASAAAHIDASEEAEASLAQLEVEGLLREARPDPGLEAPVLELARELAALLRALPDAEVPAAGGAAAAVRGLLADLAYQPVRPFVFRAPTLVRAVGSFVLRAALRPEPRLDLALLMPAACFDAKDQLNHRYFAKRALYLAHVAAALAGHPRLARVAWECACNDPRRPALLLHPAAGLSPGGCAIRLLPAAPLELCPLPRLAPDRNNLRTAVALPPAPATPAPAAPAPGATEPASAAGGKRGKAAKQQQQLQQQQQQQQQQGKRKRKGKGKAAPAPAPAEPAAEPAAEPEEPRLLPTPHYNASVLQDMLMLPLDAACRAAAAGCPHFGDAAALLRVWARQHALGQGADGLSGCVLTLLLTHLLQSGQASPGMTAVHLFRAVLVALTAPKALASPGLFMQRAAPAGAAASAPPPEPHAWRRAADCVFVDPSGWLNLAAPLSRAAVAGARGAAARALAALSTGGPEAWDAVFLSPQPRAALFDYWYHVRVGGGGAAAAAELHGDAPAWRADDARVEALAAKALGSRARLVRAFRRAPAPAGGAPFAAGAPRPQQPHVLLGVQVDPTAALRGLDMGPPADQAPAAAAFRAFWGDKAELRRFRDGAIAEAVVWECDAAHRHLVPDSIVSYALGRHLPPGTAVACHAGALDGALRRRHSTPERDVAAARLCEAAAARLGKALRSLAADALPLRVVAVQPLAPVLRHAAAFPPAPQLLAGAAADAAGGHVARCLEPVELLCQLEGSGRWPDSPDAFFKTKAAVGCQLASHLHTALGLEAAAAEGWVDVLADGFAFRLLLATERDAAMRQRAAEAAGGARVPPELDMALRAWHQGAMSGVAAANPAFEPAVRLAKRWVGARLLSPHLGEEAVELLAAHGFCAAPPPGSRLSGLLRFLRLLGDHPWRVAPLVVDPQGELGRGARDDVARRHAAARRRGDAPALCLATPADPDGGAWTRGRPSAQVLHRVAVLARRSAAALERLLLGEGPPAAADAAAAPAAANGGAAAGADGSAAAGVGAGAACSAACAAAAAAVFDRGLLEYDVLLELRADALPSAANDLRLGGGSGGDGAAAAARRPPLGPALRDANDRLAAAAAAAAAAPGAKHSRAVLKGIPHSVLAARGHHAVRRELLVGFDPLPPLVAALQARLGGLALAFADFVGGRVVALKWRAAALAPAPLDPDAAHQACPAGSAEAAAARELAARGGGAAGGSGGGGEPGAVVPDVVGVLEDALRLGAGLVESVRLQ